MPTIIIPDKICSHCGGNKWCFNEKGNRYQCHIKVLENHKRHYNNNKEKEIQRNLEYKKKNKEKHTAYSKQYFESYRKTERYKNSLRIRGNKRSEELTDSYIKDRLFQESNRILKFNDFDQSLIELKRKQLVLKRQLKTQKHGNS